MDRYEIIGVLGKGSYGIVHKCRDRDTGETVAVKKFIAGNDGKQMKKTFQREVTMLQVGKFERRIYRLRRFAFIANVVLCSFNDKKGVSDLRI